MKLRYLVPILIASGSLGLAPRLVAQSSVVAYEGQVQVSGTNFSGAGQFKFSLVSSNGQVTYWSHDGTGVAGAAPVSAVTVPVGNGTFVAALGGTNSFPGMTAPISTNVFTHSDVRLRIWFNDGIHGFLLLSPDQRLTSVPYAMAARTAEKAADSQKLAGASWSALFDDGNPATGKLLSSIVSRSDVDADSLDGFDSSQFWKLNGNDNTIAGTHFLGTVDLRPLEFRVNGQRALRLEPGGGGSVNLVVGANIVSPGVWGATISGGGSPGAEPHQVDANYGTIGGGKGNRIATTGDLAVIAGGWDNLIAASGATISGGAANTNHSSAATISGGAHNQIQTNAGLGVIGGGWMNRIGADSDSGAIGGGQLNLIGTNTAYAVISGGIINTNNASFSAIGGGVFNTILKDARHSVISGGNGNVISNGSWSSVIAGGEGNRISLPAAYASISGGAQNTNNGQYAAIAGGTRNTIQKDAGFAVISGGSENVISNLSWQSVIAGGFFNRIGPNALYAAVVGGYSNVASASHTFAAGRRAKATHHGSFVWADSQDADFSSTGPNQFLIRAAGGVGIGTVSPNAPLHVTGTSAAEVATIESSGPTSRLSLHAAGDGGRRWSIESTSGSFKLADSTANADRFLIDTSGNVGIGTITPTARLEVNGSLKVTGANNSVTTPVLTITGGSDVAEPFEMSGADIAKGAVVVINAEQPGRLKMSERAYDTRVAGIVSGAGGVQPGITLRQQGVLEGGQNVALSGRVYVQADATEAPIQPGDLLTTSDVPGHAMKVTEHARAQGAILGKAMTGLKEGRGLVLVLVTLQ